MIQQKSQSQKLEVVLKCDVAGTEEAINASLVAIQVPNVDISVIQSGVGNVTQSDILMALTGSRLILGFNVDVMPRVQQELLQQGVEVRLYDTIYALTEDVKKLAGHMIAEEPREEITGSAKIIATFRGGRKKFIIGCEVLDGAIEMGKKFRVISAMGPVYSGRISSLQVERKNVKIAKKGQEVGIKIDNWQKAKIGDLVECYTVRQPDGAGPWKPRPGVLRSKS